MNLSESAATTGGILLITYLAVAWGGLAVLRMVRGGIPVTDFQLRFARAGHAHAGVFVLLSLVIQPYVDATHLSGVVELVARDGVPAAAILFPLGFFLSSAGANRTAPNRLIVLVYAGAVCLAAGVLTLGIGLLRT